jgi:hypothetical protein
MVPHPPPTRQPLAPLAWALLTRACRLLPSGRPKGGVLCCVGGRDKCFLPARSLLRDSPPIRRSTTSDELRFFCTRRRSTFNISPCRATSAAASSSCKSWPICMRGTTRGRRQNGIMSRGAPGAVGPRRADLAAGCAAQVDDANRSAPPHRGGPPIRTRAKPAENLEWRRRRPSSKRELPADDGRRSGPTRERSRSNQDANFI